jgi:hypothetical protein
MFGFVDGNTCRANARKDLVAVLMKSKKLKKCTLAEAEGAIRAVGLDKHAARDYIIAARGRTAAQDAAAAEAADAAAAAAAQSSAADAAAADAAISGDERRCLESLFGADAVRLLPGGHTIEVTVHGQMDVTLRALPAACFYEVLAPALGGAAEAELSAAACAVAGAAAAAVGGTTAEADMPVVRCAKFLAAEAEALAGAADAAAADAADMPEQVSRELRQQNKMMRAVAKGNRAPPPSPACYACSSPAKSSLPGPSILKNGAAAGAAGAAGAHAADEEALARALQHGASDEALARTLSRQLALEQQEQDALLAARVLQEEQQQRHTDGDEKLARSIAKGK